MRHHRPLMLLFACLAITFFIYLPGTSGYFLFDDSINIVDNDHIRIQSLDLASLNRVAFSGNAGMLGRPISVVSFALNYYFSGLSPYHFKLTNIVIHLVSGVFVYLLTLLILEAGRQRNRVTINSDYVRWISLAVASAWLFHPLNLTGVLYIVQRMTSLAALFTFMGMVSYLLGRQQIAAKRTGWIWILASFVLFTPLAAFSKENGALLPVLLLVLEFTLLQFETTSKAAKRGLIAIFCISVLLPLVATALFLIANPGWLAWGYRVRDYTLLERLMTEPRILWFYIQSVFAPNLSLLGIYHDDILPSRSLLEPVSTLFSIIGILLLIAAGFLLRKRYPIAAFGILFFLAGHSLESSIIPLELVFEHRNYLPIYSLLLALIYYLLYPLRHVQSLKARQILVVGFVLALAGLTFMRATQWGDHRLMKEMAAANHPNSARSNADIGALYANTPATSQAQANEYYRRAYEYFRTAATVSPSDTLGLLGLIDLNLKYKLPIEESWVHALTYRIEHFPLQASTGNSLNKMASSLSNGNDLLSPEIVETLLRAALRNSTLQGYAKAQILFALSDFLSVVRHDRDAATKAAYEGAATAPNRIEIQLMLIRILISLDKTNEARAQIERVRKLDDEGQRLNGTALDQLAEIVASRNQLEN